MSTPTISNQRRIELGRLVAIELERLKCMRRVMPVAERRDAFDITIQLQTGGTARVRQSVTEIDKAQREGTLSIFVENMVEGLWPGFMADYANSDVESNEMPTDERGTDDTDSPPFVYCWNHARVHKTGWCNAGNETKIGIWADDLDGAIAQGKRLAAAFVRPLKKPQ